jgi:hypothetical protein
LFALVKVEGSLETAAAKAGMDAKTARKYRRLGRLPSELTPEPRWRTREDAFQGVWEEAQSLLEGNQGLEAKTIFEYLQRRYRIIKGRPFGVGYEQCKHHRPTRRRHPYEL